MSDDDVEPVLMLNEAFVTALSPLDADRLRAHRLAASWVLVCVDEGAVAAFAIAYEPGAAYASANYRWHGERFDDFAYLDRVVVDPRFRRRGIATALYDEIETDAKPHGRLVCEVNSVPPNVESLAFHKARGYHEVGHLTQEDGHQTVMLEKPL